ncbi:MAG: glycosyltransferase [Acidobacteriota bacterium]
MPRKILFVERKVSRYVSIEKAFRQIAACISERYETGFQQLPYGPKFFDSIRNLLFFRKGRADIYHITGHVHYIALLFSPRNTVLSVMDVRFISAPRSLRRFVLKKLYLDLPVKRLKYITAISDQTRADILKYTGCSPEKVRTLELPLCGRISSTELKPFDAACPIILQIGTMENKNLPMLARALNGINCRLRIIGVLTEDQLKALSENHINYENAFDLSDDDIRSEYNNADIVAFCSILEGFGLPIIEAQSMGKPVITSDLSPMKETSGGAAHLADPFDHESIRSGIKLIIDDAGYRTKLIEAGYENVERFAPEHIAAQYEKLYDEILGSEA